MNGGITLLSTEKEGGDIAVINIDVRRKGFDAFVHRLREELSDEYEGTTVKIIREGKRNPMIKISEGDKIYFHYSAEETAISVKMAGARTTQTIMNTIREISGEEAEGAQPPYEGEPKPGSRDEPERYTGESVEDVEEITGDVSASFDAAWESLGESGTTAGRTRQVPPEETEFEEDEREAASNQVKFTPPFSKEDADYHPPAEGPEPHLDCKDCAHYIEGNGCHVVQGYIHEDGYCEDLYADFGIFGKVEGNSIIVNLAQWGDRYRDRMEMENIREGISEIKETLQGKLGR